MGLEPTAYRLTAGCSTIELPWNIYKEATSRFELEIKELQSTALPLGYVAMKNQIMGWIKRFELSVSRATIWRFNQLSYTHHILVEVKGLEPPAPWSQTTCATKLRYTSSKWRRRRDSNPRTGLIQPNPLAGDPLEPLEYFSKI